MTRAPLSSAIAAKVTGVVVGASLTPGRFIVELMVLESLLLSFTMKLTVRLALSFPGFSELLK